MKKNAFIEETFTLILCGTSCLDIESYGYRIYPTSQFSDCSTNPEVNISKCPLASCRPLLHTVVLQLNTKYILVGLKSCIPFLTGGVLLIQSFSALFTCKCSVGDVVCCLEGRQHRLQWPWEQCCVMQLHRAPAHSGNEAQYLLTSFPLSLGEDDTSLPDVLCSALA